MCVILKAHFEFLFFFEKFSFYILSMVEFQMLWHIAGDGLADTERRLADGNSWGEAALTSQNGLNPYHKIPDTLNPYVFSSSHEFLLKIFSSSHEFLLKKLLLEQLQWKLS